MAKPNEVYTRDVLIDHLDNRPVPLNTKHPRWETTKFLLRAGLLKYGAGHRHSLITEAGRLALCRVLGEYAEVLIRAGFKEGAEVKNKLALTALRQEAILGDVGKDQPTDHAVLA